jgi:hypothetical protein
MCRVLQFALESFVEDGWEKRVEFGGGLGRKVHG